MIPCRELEGGLRWASISMACNGLMKISSVLRLGRRQNSLTGSPHRLIGGSGNWDSSCSASGIETGFSSSIGTPVERSYSFRLTCGGRQVRTKLFWGEGYLLLFRTSYVKLMRLLPIGVMPRKVEGKGQSCCVNRDKNQFKLQSQNITLMSR